MTIKIEIPSDNKPLALAIGRALTEYAGEAITGRVCIGEIEVNAEDLTAKAEEESLGELNNELDPVDTATTVGGSMGTLNSDGAGAGQQSTGGETDEKGVPFIPATCGNAAIPFYTSGPRKGQWKKLRGVSDEDYDKAYNSALSQAAATQQQTATTEQSAEEVFGGQQQQQQQSVTSVEPQQVFELYSMLVQQGKVEEANAVVQKDRVINGESRKGLANGTLIYGAPEFVPFIFPELQAVAAAAAAQQGA